MNSTLIPLWTILPNALASPIRETHATVRLGRADVPRLRSAMDAVAVAEIDPGVADRIKLFLRRATITGARIQVRSVRPLLEGDPV